MDYATKLAHWQSALTAVEQNINMGQNLKAKSLAILNSIEVEKGKLKEIDPKDLAALIHNAAEAMLKGVKLEQDSRKERLILLQNKPLDLGE